jgi:type VI protein secretion system component VasK
MDSTFRDTSVVAQGDPWVLGNVAAAQTPDRAAMLAELQRRYRSEYVQRWRDFVDGARVLPAVDLRDAVSKLGVIRGSQSPTLAVLALAARNTAIDSAMSVAFQPVHHVAPPRDKEIVSEKSRSYVSALGNLFSAVDQVAKMPAGGDSLSVVNRSQAAQQVLTAQAVAATSAALDLASGFASDSAAARVGPMVDALLRAPIEMVGSPLRAVAGARPRPTVTAGCGCFMPMVSTGCSRSRTPSGEPIRRRHSGRRTRS